jgi:hypothetical protein
MIISKPQVQDACRGHITYPKIKILRIRTGEIEKFSCTTDTKSTLVYKNYVERTCYSRYEKTYNSPLPLYDFVLLSWLHSSYKCNLFTIVNKVIRYFLHSFSFNCHSCFTLLKMAATCGAIMDKTCFIIFTFSGDIKFICPVLSTLTH